MLRWLLNRHPNAQAMGMRGFIKRLIVLFFIWLLLYQLWIFLHICWWTQFNPSSTAFMQAQLNELQKTKPDATLQYQWVDYAHISNHLKRAVIASEDANFLQHQGIDWQAIRAAYERNRKKGKIVSGGSTISQQLAKNLFLSAKRTPWRKGQEVIITYMLETMMSKQRILEIYLNVIEWGHGIFGAEAAAQHYFKIPATRLSKAQAAKLAVMIPNPRYYDDHTNTRYLGKRTATIKTRMQQSPIP